MLSHVESQVRGICRQLGLLEDLTSIEQAWSAEMGGWESMAGIAALERGGTLVIEVYSSPALQEITLRRKELVRRLNRHLSRPFIRDIAPRLESRNAHGY